MVSRSILPPASDLLEMVEQGMTNADIGDRFGVTGEAVRQKLATIGYRRQPDRGSYMPFRRVRADHASHYLARCLRTYLKRKQGREITLTEARRLDAFTAYLDGDNEWRIPLSVHYSREDDDGFWLEPRQEEDSDYVHRSGGS